MVEKLQECNLVDKIWLVDNSGLMTEKYQFMGCGYISGHGNIGYGRGHNLVIDKSLETDADYHLVMNSDLEFGSSLLEKLTEFMDANSDVAYVMPKVLNTDGTDQMLAKNLPTLWDLVHRRLFKSNRGALNLSDKGTWNVPCLSGCFMFLRSSALRELKRVDGYVFDPRFFLYFEDFDLSRRLNMRFRTIYYPSLSITHYHKRESYKSFRIGLIHTWSMVKYFWKWR